MQAVVRVSGPIWIVIVNRMVTLALTFWFISFGLVISYLLVNNKPAIVVSEPRSRIQ